MAGTSDETRLPGYILEALTVLRPPERMTVSEWADENRILDAKTSAEPGRWRTERTPYLRGIMDAWGDKAVERITFLKPTQVGGTEALLNAMAYAAAQDPAPMMAVYPTVELAQYTSENRIQPMLRLCEATAERFDPNSKMLELQFPGMYIVLSGANSPASLASRPIRYLLLDEVDKYPRMTGKEANPINLAIERTKTFPNTKKIFITSTPTLETGEVWQSWEAADTQYEYFVPCQHCGEEQTLRFPQLRWDDVPGDVSRARETAVYVCPKCGGAMTDRMIRDAVRKGEWRATRTNGSRLHSAYRLNAIYSPWLTLGDIAAEFKASKDDPESLMNFVNSWLAEPWKEIEGAADAQALARKTSGYPRGVVPEGAAMLTAGVDVQRSGMYYVIRAWLPDGTNCLIENGFVREGSEIEGAMNRLYRSPDNREYVVSLCLVDSGDQTDEVYEFCAVNREWAAPSKGSSRQMYARYRISRIEREGSRANGMQLIIVDTTTYKDAIYGRILAAGGFQIYEDAPEEYVNQVTAEQKITTRRNGKRVSVWVPKTSHADNHYLDCEVYAAAAADIAGYRTITRAAARGENAPEEIQDSSAEPSDWIGDVKSW